jgi:transposase
MVPGKGLEPLSAASEAAVLPHCTNPEQKLYPSMLLYILYNIRMTRTITPRNQCVHCFAPTFNKFCSRRCVGLHIQNSPKSLAARRARRTCICKICAGHTRTKSKICGPCQHRSSVTAYGLSKKISDFKSTYARHRYNKIRNHAHNVAAIANLSKLCRVCGYSLHVQLGHIKAIASFPKDTLLATVNDLSNLGYFCPNHHWELDHGLLSLSLNQ